MVTLTPIISTTPSVQPNYNVSMAETFSWIPIENNANRPLFARAGYITNLSDINVTLSAGNLAIGSVAIKDGNSNREADVEAIGNGLNALRVLTQALAPDADTVSLGDRTGNNVTVNPVTSSLNVNLTNASPLSVSVLSTPVLSFPNSNLDAFNRLRTSSPYTLFDSSHRYQDNGLWSTSAINGGTSSFDSNQGLMRLTTNISNNSEVIRETTKTFAYQPGKSLLTMNTFVFAQSATNVRQRVGYFGNKNGYFLELNEGTLSFVERTSVSGITNDTKKQQSTWNIDPLDGSGPSGLVLDITKAQILWFDMEWLGVGTVRAGFVIDGQFIHCHSFHHANVLDSTYITTACLPVRYEIANTGPVVAQSTLKQICSTVISEGGYELRGEQKTVSTPLSSPATLPVAGVFHPVISLRLKAVPDRLDAIVILSSLSLMGVGNGITYQWRLVSRSNTSGGSWIDGGADSSVEYNITGTSVSGGKTLASGFFNSSNQSTPTISIPKADLFKFQLERNSLTSSPLEMCLQIASSTNTELVYASLDWEEISR